MSMDDDGSNMLMSSDMAANAPSPIAKFLHMVILLGYSQALVSKVYNSFQGLSSVYHGQYLPTRQHPLLNTSKDHFQAGLPSSLHPLIQTSIHGPCKRV